MPRSPALRQVSWQEIAEFQSGAISRSQLLDLGLTPAQARADITTGRWATLHPGVYVTFTGPTTTVCRIWAAVLYAGQGAAASHATALWLWNIRSEPPSVIDVVVPESRRVLARSGIRVHRRGSLDAPASQMVHPSAQPPRVRAEEAILDVCDDSTASAALDLVLRAAQRRLTTADRLRRSIRLRGRVRWRSLLEAVLTEVEDGVASPLELSYHRSVERRHRLPVGVRNAAETGPNGSRQYRDVRYHRWRVIVELDGLEAHPREEAFRDMRRDNATALTGQTTLRYGWRDVLGDPCAVAAQVGAVLALTGWTGRPRVCGPRCSLVAGL